MHSNVANRFSNVMGGLAPNRWRRPIAIIAATPFFMGVAAVKFKNGDMEAMGKNLGGAVCLFLVPKIVEVIISWAQR
jgi:hypothetical protein